MSHQEFSGHQSFVVLSSAFRRVEFGTAQFGQGEMNAILVKFNSGVEYIYLGVPQDVYLRLLQLVQDHIETAGSIRVGAPFNMALFQRFPCYARLNTNI